MSPESGNQNTEQIVNMFAQLFLPLSDWLAAIRGPLGLQLYILEGLSLRRKHEITQTKHIYRNSKVLPNKEMQWQRPKHADDVQSFSSLLVAGIWQRMLIRIVVKPFARDRFKRHVSCSKRHLRSIMVIIYERKGKNNIINYLETIRVFRKVNW